MRQNEHISNQNANTNMSKSKEGLITEGASYSTYKRIKANSSNNTNTSSNNNNGNSGSQQG